jgi:hypothetical protein
MVNLKLRWADINHILAHFRMNKMLNSVIRPILKDHFRRNFLLQIVRKLNKTTISSSSNKLLLSNQPRRSTQHSSPTRKNSGL